MTDTKELDKGDGYTRELLKDMQMQVSYSDLATMPIPLYERIKQRIGQFITVNEWRIKSEARQYELARELEAAKYRETTLDSEKAMNAELTQQLTTTQQKLDVAVEALNEVERLCELTPPLTINEEHSEGWIHLAGEIKAALNTIRGK